MNDIIIVAIILVVGILIGFIFVLFRMNNEDVFDVFSIENDKLIVRTGLLRSEYPIEEINVVFFSKRRERYGYLGLIKVVLLNGHKSRTFAFDASVYTKSLISESTEELIDLSIDMLIKELQAHRIRCMKKTTF